MHAKSSLFSSAALAGALLQIIEFCLGLLWFLLLFGLAFYTVFWLPADIMSAAEQPEWARTWMFGVSALSILYSRSLVLLGASLWRRPRLLPPDQPPSPLARMA